MSAFPDTLEFRDAGMIGGSRVFQLTKEFRYLSTAYGEIRVPAWFLTDGASVPRLFWNILSPFGDYFGAAVIHDFLYSPNNRRHDRETCDAIFLAAMEDAGVSWIKRRTIYRAVRLAGWRSYRGKP